MKKLFVFCLAATMMLAFAGCNSKNDAEITTQPETEIITASPETEAVTAMGDIIITRADVVFEEKTTAEELLETEKAAEETTEEKTDAPETEIPEPATQSGSDAEALIGGWQYVYEDSGYTLIQRIYINEDGTASYAYGVYAGEYISWYDGTWYEENGTVYFNLIGGEAEMGDPEEIEAPTDRFTMQLGWEENANGITFIDHDDALVKGDAPGSSYNFVPSEI
ncbi:MAG: hypothetical protein IJE48_02630 [Clostridia bacterium]|nr:hypothetical protein [Clostridia bacterium]